ncbi:MAG: DUF389 domain-containing protein [Candidatus Nomurabacteria bacterium]|nr:DUF389 domain-containing protein [Candidatus Nomurabacteria bacterium]
MTTNPNKKDDLLNVSQHDKYKTIDVLIEKSKPNQTFWALLALSSIIITGGLLLGNQPIVIGGMLVTPMLTPLLVIALGVSVGDILLIKRTILLVLQSATFVILGAVIMAVIFNSAPIPTVLANTLSTALLYFIIALVSGVAATFAWVRKEVSETLPGVAIAVSLVPPLSLIGMNIARLEWEHTGFWAGIFVLNFIGITVGSMVVFSLSQFNRAAGEVKEKNEEVIVEAHLKKLDKELRGDTEH